MRNTYEMNHIILLLMLLCIRKWIILHLTSCIESPLSNDISFDIEKCDALYLDVGSNIGVQVRKLFEPQKYPNSPSVKLFDSFFGKSRKDVCAIGFEPNPKHITTLKNLQECYERKDIKTHFYLMQWLLL